MAQLRPIFASLVFHPVKMLPLPSVVRRPAAVLPPCLPAAPLVALGGPATSAPSPVPRGGVSLSVATVVQIKPIFKQTRTTKMRQILLPIARPSLSPVSPRHFPAAAAAAVRGGAPTLTALTVATVAFVVLMTGPPSPP